MYTEAVVPWVFNAQAVEEMWVDAIIKNNSDSVRDILSKGLSSVDNISLKRVVYRKRHTIKRIQSQCSLISSPYIPDNAWCLAAMLDARDVLQVMRDFRVTVNQVNSHGNNFLHCIIAHASVRSEDGEKHAIKAIDFIKSMLSDDEFREILLTENEDTLRPLELAAHLGTFIVFKYLFEGSNIYRVKIEDFSFYTVHYYDITEYVNGKRRYTSPLFLIMFLDKGKLYHRSTRYMFLEDPMASWFEAVKCSNMPFMITWAFLRILLIVNFFASVAAARHISDPQKISEINNFTGNTTTTEIDSDTESTKHILLFTSFCYNAVFSILFLVVELGTLVVKLIHTTKIRWLTTNILGYKNLVMYIKFYFLCQIVTFLGVFMMSQDLMIVQMAKKSEIFSSNKISGMVLIAIWFGVWDILYFLQLVPGLNFYAIAVQRMLLDLFSFSFIFILFFASYGFGFYILDNDHHGSFMMSLYDTFRIMLNMKDFSHANSAVQLLHVIFIFMIMYLLLNILIAIFTSSFEEIKKQKEIIMRLQSLAIAFGFEHFLPRFMSSLYDFRRRKYLVYEGEKIFITKVVMKSGHTESYPVD